MIRFWEIFVSGWLFRISVIFIQGNLIRLCIFYWYIGKWRWVFYFYSNLEVSYESLNNYLINEIKSFQKEHNALRREFKNFK